jgi:hypothetical protein
VIAIGTAAAPSSFAQPGVTSDEEFLSVAKSTLVSRIEPGLPDEPVETWLASLLGSNMKAAWEVTDCIQQTKAPKIDSETERPICATITAEHHSGYLVRIDFQVGTSSRRLTDKRNLYRASEWGPTAHNTGGFSGTLSILRASIRERTVLLDNPAPGCVAKTTSTLFSNEALSCLRGARRKVAKLARTQVVEDQDELIARTKEECRNSVSREAWITHLLERVGGHRAHTIDTWPEGVFVIVNAVSVDYYEDTYWSYVTLPDHSAGWVTNRQLRGFTSCAE